MAHGRGWNRWNVDDVEGTGKCNQKKHEFIERKRTGLEHSSQLSMDFVFSVTSIWSMGDVRIRSLARLKSRTLTFI
jgi:hypothetical protein